MCYPNFDYSYCNHNIIIDVDCEKVINYNGYTSLETAESYIVEFTYFKAPYKEEYATYNDAFAQMYFDMDNNGKITSIRWYYYPQID